MIYLALVPIASFITETLFLQPQALLLGVPLAGIGRARHGSAAYEYAGSNWSDRFKSLFGEGRLIYIVPADYSCQLDRAGSVSKTPGTGVHCCDWFLHVRDTPDPVEPDSE